MPVQTRSQFRNKCEINNIEVKLMSNNTRLVKFTTPENPEHIVSCPSSPRAPRASKKMYHSFGNAVRQLDFTSPKKLERYPLNYKNFIIANKFQKHKVDEFLEMVNKFAEYRPAIKDEPKNSFKLRVEQLSSVSDDDLLDMAKILNSNTKFWAIFNENEYNETTLNCSVYYWANLLSSVILIYLTRVVTTANKFPVHLSRKVITDKLITTLIIFKDVFMNENFPRFSHSRRFLGTVMKKMMEFGYAGYILSSLVIRHYYPNMVTKECYPIINIFPGCIVYTESLEYACKTTQPDIVRLFKECQLIYNFS